MKTKLYISVNAFSIYGDILSTVCQGLIQFFSKLSLNYLFGVHHGDPITIAHDDPQNIRLAYLLLFVHSVDR